MELRKLRGTAGSIGEGNTLWLRVSIRVRGRIRRTVELTVERPRNRDMVTDRGTGKRLHGDETGRSVLGHHPTMGVVDLR